MSREAAFEQLRLAEVDDAIKLLQRHGRSSVDVLEIGAGTGWQARALSEAGFNVEAIDLPPESIRKVILGYRVSDDTKRRIRSALKDSQMGNVFGDFRNKLDSGRTRTDDTHALTGKVHGGMGP